MVPTNQSSGRVGVGITIAHDPLHGSGRADFPHPALTLGDNAHAPERIRMIDANRWQPADDESMHSGPRDTTGLAPTQKSAVPEPPYLDSKQMQRVVVHGHTVIAIVPIRPIAAIGQLPGWDDACVAEVQLSPR